MMFFCAMLVFCTAAFIYFIPNTNLKPPKRGVSRRKATWSTQKNKPPNWGVSRNTYICTSHGLSNPPENVSFQNLQERTNTYAEYECRVIFTSLLVELVINSTSSQCFSTPHRLSLNVCARVPFVEASQTI
jgi:hypothetical protein